MKKNRKNRRGKRTRQQRKPATPISTASAQHEVRVDELWLSLRQGAANVAGVRYQLAVTAWLLAQQPTATAIGEVVPEGLEDIDVIHADGSVLHVQAKERAAGLAVFRQAELVEAIAHARGALTLNEASRFVVITDAKPSDTFGEPGFDKPITQTPELVERVAERAEVDRQHAASLLGRTHIVYLPWLEVGREAEAALVARFGLAPAIARVAHARLLEELGARAAAQRGRTASDALRFARHELEALVFGLRELVDPAALEQVERDGLVSPLDFTRPISLDPGRFLLGVDVEPGHVAAGLDVLRRDELERVFEGLHEDRYVVISGPSGAGKSALMWRAAHELGGRFRLLRIRAIASDQVPNVVRYVEAQQPEEYAPILICGDDLGRPPMAGWEELTDRLSELPGTFFLGAVREEDYEPSLLRGQARVVTPHLDARLGEEVVAQLSERSISLVLEPEEAFRRADGLLMEFLTLLTAGRRIEDVVGAQVEARLADDRETERELLRHIAAAHVAGLSLRAEALEGLMPGSGAHAALRRLDQEFLVRPLDSDRWAGLHELRSELATKRLHQWPPPTEARTFARLLPLVDPDERAHLIIHAAKRGHDLTEMTATGVELLQRLATAAEAASLLHGFIQAEEVVYARRCIGVVQREMPTADIHAILSITQLIKDGFMQFPSGLPNSAHINRLAAMLPERDTSPTSALASELDGEHLVALVGNATAEDAASLLEVVAFLGAHLPEADAARVASVVSDDAELELAGRIEAAVWRMVDLAPGDAPRVLGPLESRLGRITSARRDVLTIALQPGLGHEAILTASAYDLDTGDLNDELVSFCRLVLDACPEVSEVRVDARDAAGELSVNPNNQKNLTRRALPSVGMDIRRNIAFDEGVRRLTGADSWSARLRAEVSIVKKLGDLLDQIPMRLLHPMDNAGRRRRWQEEAIGVYAEANQLPALPPPSGSVSIDRSDPARASLHAVAMAVMQLAGTLDDPAPHFVGVAMQLHEAFRRKRSKSATEFILDEEASNWPIARRLANQRFDLQRKADATAELLLLVNEQPGVRASAKPGPGQDWGDLAAQLVYRAHDDAHTAERAALEALFPDGLARVVQLPGLLSSVRLANARWLVLADLEQLEEAIKRMLSLDADLTLTLGFRTFIMATIDGGAVPVIAKTFGSRNAAPFFWPLDPSDAEELVADSSVPVFNPPLLQQALRIFGMFMEASRAASHARLRDASLGSDIEEAEARRLLADAETAIGEVTNGNQVVGVLRETADCVRSEVDGDVTASLAAGASSAVMEGEENLAAQASGALILTALDDALALEETGDADQG